MAIQSFDLLIDYEKVYLKKEIEHLIQPISPTVSQSKSLPIPLTLKHRSDYIMKPRFYPFSNPNMREIGIEIVKEMCSLEHIEPTTLESEHRLAWWPKPKVALQEALKWKETGKSVLKLWRPLLDCNEYNQHVIIPQEYGTGPITIPEFCQRIEKFDLHCREDLKHAFFQVPLPFKYRKYFVFNTPLGSYNFRVMPQGPTWSFRYMQRKSQHHCCTIRTKISNKMEF